MKKHWTTQVGDFMAGKGFYIVLLLCVATVGASGYYFYNTVTAEPATMVSEPTAITVTPTATPTPVAETVEPVKPTAAPAATPNSTTATEDAVAEVTVVAPAAEEMVEEVVEEVVEPTVVATFYTWPIRGEVMTSHSVEVLAYDVTMGDWRTHTGVDISGDLGSEVFAAGMGTVLSIEDTDLMGTTLVIDHGNGLTSTYANLEAVPTVSVGDVVSAGQTIGSIGNTAIAESALPAHLHFEMALEGASVDPLDYLP